MKTVTDAEFDQVLKSDLPVLVDFWAPWCGPCKALAPTLDALSADYGGLIEIAKVDVDENPATQDKYGVRSIPTLLLFKDGEIIARLNGVQSRARLTALLDEQLGRSASATNAPAQMTAFGGDPAQKAACIDSLKRHIDNGSVLIGHTMWDGKAGSALGCAAEAAEYDCAETLGIPIGLVRLVDVFTTYHDSVSACTGYALNWLEQVPVGADLSQVHIELLIEALSHDVVAQAIGEDREVAELHRQIIAQLRSEIDGQPAKPEEWAELRARAETIEPSSFIKVVIRQALEASCWIATDDASVTEAVVHVTKLALGFEMERRGWSPEADKRIEDRLGDIWKEYEARGETLSNREVMDVMRKEDPDLMRRFEEQAFARSKAMKELGQQFSRSLDHRTASAR